MAEELERRVAQRTKQIHVLASDLEAVEDRERRQIARDLHDDLGQTLAAARIRLAALCEDRRTEVAVDGDLPGPLGDVADRGLLPRCELPADGPGDLVAVPADALTYSDRATVRVGFTYGPEDSSQASHPVPAACPIGESSSGT